MLDDWKVEGSAFTMNLTVPANSSAKLTMPNLSPSSSVTEGGKNVNTTSIPGIKVLEDGSLEVLAGSYQFKVD